MSITHYRVDSFHSNAYDMWRRMGSPVAPNRSQYAQLEAASQLARYGSIQQLAISGGSVQLSFELPRQAVSLLVLEPR